MSATRPVDAREREAAVDPRRSFIVQAPAGSGKTGLLIQRVLRLLASVERPEEILAITFTRKAAAEMRRRVMEALEGAARGTEPAGENARLTYVLAREALARDRSLGWQILDNAARLRIQTIDSLCASLARQMPVVSHIGAPPAIVDNAGEHYREAAEHTLALIDGHDEAAARVRTLLAHLDGDWATACMLLEAMLARRDQWMRPVFGFRAEGAREALERSFRAERERVLRRVREMMPPEEEGLLAGLARHAGEFFARSAPAKLQARLAGLERYPSADEEGAEDWCALAALLLVKEGEFRKSVDARTGFPASKGGRNDEARTQMKDLLERLEPLAGLAQAIDAVRGMPPPRFTDEQWNVLGAMVALLPLAVGQLQLVFAERGEIDFTGIAQAAVRALGTDDAPTDLLLALDVRLKHLLVDEFQDTSRSQWELITRLTSGWIEGDGRTVFLVGDPMQSIYRFREAEVGLFLGARDSELVSGTLQELRLATNFRSRRGIVDWVNAAFERVLPAAVDTDAGAVPHSRSHAHHGEDAGAAVTWHPFVGRDRQLGREQEAEEVARIAAAALAARPDDSIAILVRNRAHLDRIIPALKAARLRFRAVDIEPLAGRQVIQDLLAITRALSHPADRVAWLSLLRAPWCAMGLADLHALAATDATIWEALNDEGRLADLSRAGEARARRLRETLAPRVADRLRGDLAKRVEDAWLALGGPACVERASDLEDAETFLDQLGELSEAGELADPARLEEHLARLYAAPDVGDEARLQLMTIHKAKGLEFGTVILPGLDRLPRTPMRPLFAWKARADGTLMMAPVRATGTREEPAYDYLLRLEDAAAEHEVARLLYVATTRAVSKLHLLGYVRLNSAGKVVAPSFRSLLGKAWPWQAVQDEFARAVPPGGALAQEETPPLRPRAELRELDHSAVTAAMAVAAQGVPVAAPGDEPATIEFSWVGETARHVGTITHRWLQRIATQGLAHWDRESVAGLAPAVERALGRRGVPPNEREEAVQRVLGALEGAVTDERGRWVLDAHRDARCEYRLRVVTPEGVRLRIIDRMFTDAAGRRWIVDYKTGAHQGGDLDAFLDREQERYGPQLSGYAAALARGEVSLGLYFPLVNGWREWSESGNPDS